MLSHHNVNDICVQMHVKDILLSGIDFYVILVIFKQIFIASRWHLFISAVRQPLIPVFTLRL